MINIKKLKVLYSFSLKNTFYETSFVIMSFFSILMRCGLLIYLYSYLFKIKGTELRSYDFREIAWNMVFYFTFLNFRIKEIARDIMKDVKSGNIEVLLVKPFSYLIYKMINRIAIGSYLYILNLIVCCVIMFLFVGIPEHMQSFQFIISFIVTLVFSVILSLFIFSLLGLMSFWMEDIEPLFWIVDKSIMILGGSYLPIAFFPELMKYIAILSPVGASLFLTHSAYSSWFINLFFFLTIQVGWILILGLLLRYVYSLAKSKLFINGG